MGSAFSKTLENIDLVQSNFVFGGLTAFDFVIGKLTLSKIEKCQK
jgi:hypothetical protein